MPCLRYRFLWSWYWWYSARYCESSPFESSPDDPSAVASYFAERGTWDETLGLFLNSDGDPSQFAVRAPGYITPRFAHNPLSPSQRQDGEYPEFEFARTTPAHCDPAMTGSS